MPKVKLQVIYDNLTLDAWLVDRGPRTLLIRFANCFAEIEFSSKHDVNAELAVIKMQSDGNGYVESFDSIQYRLKWNFTELRPEESMENHVGLGHLPVSDNSNLSEYSAPQIVEPLLSVSDNDTRDEIDYLMQHTGASWAISFLGQEFTVRDHLGARYVAHLLANPGTVFEASQLRNFLSPEELDQENSENSTLVADGAIESSTKENVIRLKRRWHQLEADREREANPSIISEIEEELQSIESELNRILNRAGGIRKEGGTLDRDRKSVSNAIRRGIYKETNTACPSCLKFFEARIDLGAQCMFFPADGEQWKIRFPRKSL